MKRILFCTLTLAAAMTMTTGCGPKQQETETASERVEQVEASILKRKTINRQLELSTTLQAYETVNVAPSLTGIIEKIYVEVGDRVKAGDTLVRMDQNQFRTTGLALANLRTEMERTTALYESGALSKQVYDQTKLSYDQTVESLDFLRENTFVKAPFSGVISAKNYEDGELYSGQAVVSLIDIARLKALINIPETYFPMIREGMELSLRSDIYPGRTFRATVEIVYPTVDIATHTFQARIVLSNRENLLRPGMFVRTTMDLDETTAMVIPYQAVQKLIGSNERYVFIEKGGKAKRVFVKLGARYNEEIEIISDELQEGDRLITTGQAKLVDGVKLNLVKVHEQ